MSPQPTGVSVESNLIDARLQRLKLEGTPRVKRERRAAAPPLSPIPASSDFSDFMLPSMGDESDYGSLAQKMLDDLFNPESGVSTFEVLDDPPSPSPGGNDLASLLGGKVEDVILTEEPPS